jgi:hypothetical protein
VAPCDACGGILVLPSPRSAADCTARPGSTPPCSQTSARPAATCGRCGAVNAVGDTFRQNLGLPPTATMSATRAADVQAGSVCGRAVYLRAKRDELQTLRRALAPTAWQSIKPSTGQGRRQGADARAPDTATREDAGAYPGAAWAVVVRDVNERTPSGQPDSGPQTLGSVQCAQLPVVDTDTTTTPVLEQRGVGLGDSAVDQRQLRGADGYGAGHVRGGRGDSENIATVAAATAAALSTAPCYHLWVDGAASPGPEVSAGERERLQAAALRCEWQIAWVEDGGAQSSGSHCVDLHRRFEAIDRAMLAVCLDACKREPTRARMDSTSVSQSRGGGGKSAASVLKSTDAFLASQATLMKLRRRSKASAAALRRCRSDAETLSRLVSGSRSSLMPGGPLAHGIFTAHEGRAKTSSEATGLLGRLLTERADAAHADAVAAARPHAALLDAVNFHLGRLFAARRPQAGGASLAALLLRLHRNVHRTLARCEARCL